jgi:predicted DNA-binding protein
MPCNQNQSRVEPKKKTAKRKDKSVLKNVVSLRVSDQEKRVLERITRSSYKNVSEIVREAIEFWLSKRQRLCGES